MILAIIWFFLINKFTDFQDETTVGISLIMLILEIFAYSIIVGLVFGGLC